jgi:hypothetical protein
MSSRENLRAECLSVLIHIQPQLSEQLARATVLLFPHSHKAGPQDVVVPVSRYVYILDGRWLLHLGWHKNKEEGGELSYFSYY